MEAGEKIYILNFWTKMKYIIIRNAQEGKNTSCFKIVTLEVRNTPTEHEAIYMFFLRIRREGGYVCRLTAERRLK